MIKIIFLFVYRAILAPFVVIFLLPLGNVFIPKVREGLRLRRKKRDWPVFKNPPLWIHASSGEFEYAKPVIRELKRRHPELPIVVTYFSPTYATNIERFPGVDFSIPLPLDLPGPTRSFLKKLKPRMGILARTDLWPEILNQASHLEIPLVLFSATKSRSPNLFSRAYLKWLYGYLRIIFCVSPADAGLIHKIAPDIRVDAIGDTRFDQVRERLKHPREIKTDLQPSRSLTLVAGSTWPQDEQILLEACSPLLQSGTMKLILAPHEPTESHLKDLGAQLERRNLSFSLYSKASHFDTHVLLIDQVGILAELYTWGRVALVGGSFKSSVHSVMEPLAAGCVTFVGPHHLNNREAIEFQHVGPEGHTFVQEVKNAADLRGKLEQALQSQSANLSQKIRQEIENRCGATQKLVEYFEQSF